jgi:hypothetical protein
MSDRAVSEVISYVLVFGLIVSAVAIISVSGLSTLQDVRNDEQIDNAERAFDILSDNVEDIYRRGAPSRATEISLGEAELSTGSNVTMRVEIDETADGTYNVDEDFERNVRPVVYSGDDNRKLVYEAGAVFRTNRDGGVTVQEPPFLVDEERVHLPVVGLNRPGVQSLGGSTVLVRTNLRSRTVEYEDTGDTVEEIRIQILESEHGDQWVDYLQSEGFTDCQSVTVGGDDGVQCDFNPDPSTIDIVYVVDYDIEVNIDP